MKAKDLIGKRALRKEPMNGDGSFTSGAGELIKRVSDTHVFICHGKGKEYALAPKYNDDGWVAFEEEKTMMKIKSINIQSGRYVYNIKVPPTAVEGGFKIISSEEVPGDELWFIDRDGTMNKITNIGLCND